MTRILAQYVSLATAALGLIELILSFLIIEAFLNMPGGVARLSPEPLPLDADLTALAAMFAVITGGVATTIGLYRPEVCLERRQLFVSAAVAGIVAFPVLLLVSGGFHIGLTGWVILWLAVVLLVWQAGILLTHLAFSAVLRPEAMMRRILILGSERRAARLAHVLRSARVPAFEPVIATTAGIPSPQYLRERRIWGIVVAAPDAAGAESAALLDSKLRGARVLDVASFCERHLGRIDLDTVDTQWLLCADGFGQGRLTNALKRGLDIAVSLPLLAVTLPVMLLIALLIKLESPGPVLYRQLRLGLHGEPFTLLKFRSMRRPPLGSTPRPTRHPDRPLDPADANR